jgi:hypothetical protein
MAKHRPVNISQQIQNRIGQQKNSSVPSKYFSKKQPEEEKEEGPPQNFEDMDIDDLIDQVKEDDVNAFVDGNMTLHVGSSWVAWFRYWPQQQELQIKFIRGKYTCLYSGIDPGTAKAFAQSHSKGKFVWATFYTMPYKLVTTTYKPKKAVE